VPPVENEIVTPSLAPKLRPHKADKPKREN
jgi:hypothetical protein